MTNKQGDILCFLIIKCVDEVHDVIHKALADDFYRVTFSWLVDDVVRPMIVNLNNLIEESVEND